LTIFGLGGEYLGTGSGVGSVALDCSGSAGALVADPIVPIFKRGLYFFMTFSL